MTVPPSILVFTCQVDERSGIESVFLIREGGSVQSQRTRRHCAELERVSCVFVIVIVMVVTMKNCELEMRVVVRVLCKFCLASVPACERAQASNERTASNPSDDGIF